MKKSLNLLIFAALFLAVPSCSFFEDEHSQKGGDETSSSIEGLSPEIKEHFVAQDSLMKDLVNKVDTLAEALNLVQNEKNELEKKIESLQSPRSTWAWMSISAAVLSIIAFLLALFKKGFNEKDILRVVNYRLDTSQRIKSINGLINDVEALKNETQRCFQPTQSSSLASQNIDARLRKIESTLSEVVNYINGHRPNNQPQPASQQENRNTKQVETQSVGYARIDAENYFTTIYDSNQEGCAFKITFKNATKGEFTIISLDRISSSNDWQQKIECSGGVSIKEATEFRIEALGVCENIGNNTWQVTKPLKIRLLK